MVPLFFFSHLNNFLQSIILLDSRPLLFPSTMLPSFFIVIPSLTGTGNCKDLPRGNHGGRTRDELGQLSVFVTMVNAPISPGCGGQDRASSGQHRASGGQRQGQQWPRATKRFENANWMTHATGLAEDDPSSGLCGRMAMYHMSTTVTKAKVNQDGDSLFLPNKQNKKCLEEKMVFLG